MNKIICFICFVFIGFGAYATEMCARRDITVVPLDSSVPRTGRFTDGAEYIWWVSFDFGTVYGSYGCFALQEIRDIENNQLLSGRVEVLSNSDDDYIGNSGWYQGNVAGGPEYERKYCFCKLTHPMSSQWAFQSETGSVQTCIDFCADFCGRVLNNMNYQRTLFNSIGK